MVERVRRQDCASMIEGASLASYVGIFEEVNTFIIIHFCNDTNWSGIIIIIIVKILGKDE